MQTRGARAGTKKPKNPPAQAQAPKLAPRPEPEPQASPARDAPWLGGLALGWVAMMAAVGLGGDYPLNDDWCYSWSARTLAFEHSLRILDWSAPVPIFQILWGAAALLVANTAVALRLAVEGWALAGVLLLYGIGRRAHFAPARAALLAAAVATSPWYVNLALCFMTDVPMLVCMWAAVYLLLPGREAAVRDRALFGAGVMVALAYLTRQFGALMAPAGAALIWLRDTANQLPLRARLRRAAAFCLPVAVAIVAASLWYARVHGQTLANHGTVMRVLNKSSAAHFLAGWHYLGLWSLPWLAAVLAHREARSALRWRTLALLMLPLVGYSAYAYGSWPTGKPVAFDVDLRPLMPYLGNLVFPLGVGVITLADAYLNVAPLPHSSAGLQWGLTALTCLAGPFAGMCVHAGLRSALRAAQACWRGHAPSAAAQARLLWMMSATTYALFMTGSSSLLFDRYLLPLMPAALWCVVENVPAAVARSRVAVAGVALMALFAAGANHEYLAWNNARQAAVRTLKARGVPQSEIDAGFEVNAAWRFVPFFEASHKLHDSDFLFWSRGTRYHVALSPNPLPQVFRAKQCQATDRFPYWTWPGARPAALYVLDCGPQEPAPPGYNP